ncbi:MAG: hypothetical protein IH605_04075 [Burkholderiales bacterium]|nr:hypothetical protein [Burkholderiales bacterium]
MKRIISVAAIALLALSSGNAIGYETDVHYGLTRWLARSAGFSEVEADEIARANERTDTGALDAKHAMIWRLCMLRDKNASARTRILHFRSQNPVPKDPPDRPVSHTESFAWLEVKTILNEHGTDSADRLNRFGQALHGLQDALSHAGIPDTVAICSRQWMWAHPEERGGYRSHQADLTYKDVPSCMTMAAITYDATSLMARNLGRGKAERFSRWAHDVELFCRADSKSGKVDWFRRRGMGQLAKPIVRTTSLRAGIEFYDDVPDLDLLPKMANLKPIATDIMLSEIVDATRSDLKSSPVPSDVRDWFNEFFQSWFAADQQGITEVASRFFAESVEVWPGARLKPRMSAAFLLYWRIRDHGQAEDLAFRENAFTATLTSEQFLPPTSDWQSYLIRERAQERPFLLVQRDGPKGVEYIAFAVLKRAPTDVIIFVAQPGAKALEITQASSIVVH